MLRACWEVFHINCQTRPCEGCLEDWPAQRDHRCLGFPTRTDDDDVLVDHFSVARHSINYAAIIGVYLDLLRFMGLSATDMHIEPVALVDGVLTEMEDDPLLAIPYSYGNVSMNVSVFINQRTSNVRHFYNGSTL